MKEETSENNTLRVCFPDQRMKMETYYFVDNFIRNHQAEEVYEKGMLLLSKVMSSDVKFLPKGILSTGNRNVCRILNGEKEGKYVYNLEGFYSDKDSYSYVVLYPLDYINVDICLARNYWIGSIVVPPDGITLLDVLEYEKRSNTLNFSKFFQLKNCICVVDEKGEDRSSKKKLRGHEEFSNYVISNTSRNSFVVCKNENELQEYLSM